MSRGRRVPTPPSQAGHVGVDWRGEPSPSSRSSPERRRRSRTSLPLRAGHDPIVARKRFEAGVWNQRPAKNDGDDCRAGGGGGRRDRPRAAVSKRPAWTMFATRRARAPRARPVGSRAGTKELVEGRRGVRGEGGEGGEAALLPRPVAPPTRGLVQGGSCIGREGSGAVVPGLPPGDTQCVPCPGTNSLAPVPPSDLAVYIEVAGFPTGLVAVPSTGGILGVVGGPSASTPESPRWFAARNKGRNDPFAMRPAGDYWPARARWTAEARHLPRA